MIGWQQTPLVDPAQLDGYAELLTAEQVATLVQAFARELDTRPALIGDLVAQGDLSGARIAAHRLKGASLTIGACRIAALSDAIEQGDAAILPELAAALPGCADETRAMMAAR